MNHLRVHRNTFALITSIHSVMSSLGWSSQKKAQKKEGNPSVWSSIVVNFSKAWFLFTVVHRSLSPLNSFSQSLSFKNRLPLDYGYGPKCSLCSQSTSLYPRCPLREHFSGSWATADCVLPWREMFRIKVSLSSDFTSKDRLFVTSKLNGPFRTARF